MARTRRGREISGFLLLDKPEGPTSNTVLQRVRRLLDARKAGHTGTLDPLATGMLPICFGAATKAAAYAIQADKVYEATGLFGTATDTGDALGAATEEAPLPMLDDAEIAGLRGRFTGEITQIPPRYSAIRREGKRFYDLARAGSTAVPPPRRVRIHELEFDSVDAAQFRIRVRCSKGTYIRTLVEDIGRFLGSCAHVTALRRLAVDPFSGMPMVTLGELEAIDSPEERGQRFLLPSDCVLGHLPRVDLRALEAERVRHGQRIRVDDSGHVGKCRIYGPAAEFIGIGDTSPAGELMPKRIFL